MNEIKTLLCQLTDAELIARADELTAMMAKITSKKDAAKEAAAIARQEISEMEVLVGELAHVVRSHKEPRSIECTWEENLGAGTMELYRVDTGDLVASRPMTPEERQGRLVLVEAD